MLRANPRAVLMLLTVQTCHLQVPPSPPPPSPPPPWPPARPSSSATQAGAVQWRGRRCDQELTELECRTYSEHHGSSVGFVLENADSLPGPGCLITNDGPVRKSFDVGQGGG